MSAALIKKTASQSNICATNSIQVMRVSKTHLLKGHWVNPNNFHTHS